MLDRKNYHKVFEIQDFCMCIWRGGLIITTKTIARLVVSLHSGNYTLIIAVWENFSDII